MKSSKAIRLRNRTDRTVAWWNALLLVGLGAVFMALFLTARLLLSFANEPGIAHTTSGRVTPLSHAQSMLPIRDDRTVRGAFGRYGQYWWHSRELC